MTKNDRLTPLQPLCEAAECLKVLAHPARLRIVEILMREDCPVGRISELCALPPHQASGHLKLMERHGLLSSERRGRAVHYRIKHPAAAEVLDCIKRHCGRSRRFRL